MKTQYCRQPCITQEDRNIPIQLFISWDMTFFLHTVLFWWISVFIFHSFDFFLWFLMFARRFSYQNDWLFPAERLHVLIIRKLVNANFSPQNNCKQLLPPHSDPHVILCFTVFFLFIWLTTHWGSSAIRLYFYWIC